MEKQTIKTNKQTITIKSNESEIINLQIALGTYSNDLLKKGYIATAKTYKRIWNKLQKELNKKGLYK